MTRTLDAGATRPAHPGETETWNRNDSASGCSVLLYTLRQDGWRKGQPVMVNDVTIHIEAANGSETPIAPIADRVLAGLASLPLPSGETRKALEAAKGEIAAALRQLDINVSIARRDHPEGPMFDGRRLDNPHFPHTQEILAGHVKDHLARISTAIDAALASEVQGWRTDMENAPRDGTRILLWLHGKRGEPVVARWYAPWENWQAGSLPYDPAREEMHGIGSLVPIAWQRIVPPAPETRT